MLSIAEPDRNNCARLGEGLLTPVLATVTGVKQRAIAAARPNIVRNDRHDMKRSGLVDEHTSPASGGCGAFEMAISSDAPLKMWSTDRMHRRLRTRPREQAACALAFTLHEGVVSR